MATVNDKEKYLDLAPADWERTQIGELFKFSSGKARPKDISKIRNDQYRYPVYGGNGVLGYSKEYSFDNPCLILGRVGEYCGCAHLTEEKSWISDNALYSKDVLAEIDFDYFKFFFDYFDLNRFSNKNGQPLITQGNVGSLTIAKPTPPEQKQIAFVLKTLQKAIQKQEEIINTTTALKKSLLNKLFTEGTKGEPLKQSEAGMIPGSWEPKQIKNIGYDFLGGGTPTTSVKEYWNGDIEWTTSKRLDPERIYIDKGEKLITAEGLKKSSSNLVPKGNLIVSTRVTVGKVVINTVDLAISQDLTGILIDISSYNPEFLAYQIQTDRVQQIFQNLKRGATIQGVTRNDMMDIYLGIPSKKDEQDEIAKSISAIDKKIAVHKKRKGIYEQLLKSLLNDLMTGAIRVNDVQFNYKSSSELSSVEQSSKTVTA